MPLMRSRRRGLRLSVNMFMLLVALIGIALLALTTTMAPYHDPAALRRAAAAFQASIANPVVALQRYAAVRDSELTPKYVLEDFGCTLLELAILGLLLLRTRALAGLRDLPRLRTPASVWRIFFLGVAATLLTNLAQVLSWMLRRSRGEFPAWIGLVSEPVEDTAKTLIFLLLVAAISAGLAVPKFRGAEPLLPAFRRDTRPDPFWIVVFGLPLAVATLWSAGTLLAGEFLYWVPSLFWIAFFACLFATKRRHLITRQRIRSDRWQ